MKDFFAEQKSAICRYLEKYLMEKGNDLGRVHSMGTDSAERILNFTEKGKMLRGGLVALAYLLTREKRTKGALPESVTAAGAVMELFQSGFLIHDDIMDRDVKRRGIRSIFAQYGQFAQDNGIQDSYHTGESLGICVGDIAFFLAFDILSGIEGRGVQSMIGLCAREISYVGVAQMMDVYWGQTSAGVNEGDILELYRYKTGRYTFSLPMMCGALLSGADTARIKVLEEIGELLGVVFQLKDDELGLFGDENQLGKPIGSDITEGKKTPFFLRLMERVTEEERKKLLSYLGNDRMTGKDMDYIRNQVESLGIRREISDMCVNYADQARQRIGRIPDGDPAYRDILLEIIEYSLNRQK